MIPTSNGAARVGLNRVPGALFNPTPSGFSQLHRLVATVLDSQAYPDMDLVCAITRFRVQTGMCRKIVVMTSVIDCEE